MSRRDRRPGPVKHGPLSATRKPPPQGSGWVSIDPTARGEPTNSIPDFSDNDNLPVPGTWYRYDPNSSLNDNPSAAGQYVKSTSSGLEFWLNRNDTGPPSADPPGTYAAAWDYNHNKAGRFVTPLMRPDGRGAVKWDDEFGIEFLIYNPADSPSALKNQTGLSVGIGGDGLLTDEASDAQTMTNVKGCFLQGWHRSATVDGMSVQFGGDHGQQSMVNSTNPKVWLHFNCMTISTAHADADTQWGPNIIQARAYTDTGRRAQSKTDSENTTITPDYTSDPMVHSQVYLYLAPFSYQLVNNTDAGADAVALGEWKVWYRLHWNTDFGGSGTAGLNFPSWVGGGGAPDTGWSGG